jgi:hypothetical protein
MTKKILLFLGLSIALTFNLNAQADFEDQTSGSFENMAYGDAQSGSLSIEANPFKQGINQTNYSLKNVRTANFGWSSSVGHLTTSTPIAVTDAHRYLHVMVYSDVSASGLIFVKGYSEDDVWATANKPESRFDFTPGLWKDVVIDLKGQISNFYGLYFLSQDWGGVNFDRSLYYDEIVLNDSPDLRTPDPITTATTVTNFENNGSNLIFSTAGNGVAETSVVTNPDQSSLNKTQNSLYLKTNTTAGDWWGGLDLNFYNPVRVNDETRYLHVLIKTTLPKFELNIFSGGEKWIGAVSPQSSDWTEYVIDLHNFNGNSATGLLMTGFRVVVFTNESGNVNKELYIDEIAVDNDPTPRTEVGGSTTAINISKETTSNIYPVSGGFYIQGQSGKVVVYGLDGTLIKQLVSSGNQKVDLAAGAYVVSLNGQKRKIIVNK